jgi:hypothetical protein
MTPEHFEGTAAGSLVDECARLRRDNARLRAWLRGWRYECNGSGCASVTYGLLTAALSGKPAPKGRRA